ncbi:MAG: type III pantothenate kinase [Gemmatimonadota bacterium]|nr:type III pantothenate kinase [Gemmatimonadota bacterium]
MIIVFDVGNSETTIGVFANGDGADTPALAAHWRLTTNASHTSDELGLVLDGLLRTLDDGAAAIHGGAIASVVPPVTAPLVEACTRWLGARPVVISGRSALPIRLQVDEPLTVGADRIVNTLAASRMYGVDTIVVDLGTATTYDCITADAVFLGGIIAPGLGISASTLVRRTSQLPATELVAPAHAIGKRTDDCIRSGVMFGTADAIDGLVRRIKREWPTDIVPKVVATGGFAEVIAPLCEEIDEVEPYLTLHGLRMAYEILRESPGT